MSYSEERERGAFVSTAINLQAFGAAVGGLIPLLINKNKVRKSQYNCFCIFGREANIIIRL